MSRKTHLPKTKVESRQRRVLRREVKLKAACPSGKRRYKDEAAALVALERIQSTDDPRRTKAPRRVYECPYCGGHHLTSQGWHPARQPLPKASPKRVKELRERKKMLQAKYGERPMCEVPGCLRWADDAHEPLTRARGGSITDPDNVVALCREHHDQITFAPETTLEWAYDLGLLIHSWSKGEQAS